uniref:uncharacterized protein LOC100176754 isoform X2 n=1 Tax=Ciona intestinalis TaxID=7719 RepID=UPI000EF54AC4|nr:uncharacterized protein LOC100176754 isoform X2 [Ciona intestinalis]|eukprot:XP_026691196.1 uncharacterized protein LOC100176754 isoform X2 [Ciona intestinalis]
MQPYSKHVDEKGLFLLIHNFKYGDRGSLKGSQKDADAIRDVVAKLDFDVILKENLTEEQIICACQGATSTAQTSRHIDSTADTTFSEVRGVPDNTPTDTDACDWLLEYSCSDGHNATVGVFTPILAKILQREIKAGSQQELLPMLRELCSQVTRSSTGFGNQVPIFESTLTNCFYPGQHVINKKHPFHTSDKTKLILSQKSYGQTSCVRDSGVGNTYEPTAESSDQALHPPLRTSEFEAAMNNEDIDNCLQNNKFRDAKELIAIQIKSTKCEREIWIYKLKQDFCCIKMGNKGKVQHHTEQWRKTICGDRYTRTKQVDDFFYVCKLFANNGLPEKALLMLQHAADLYYELGNAQSGSPGLEHCIDLLYNLHIEKVKKDIEMKKLFQLQKDLRNPSKKMETILYPDCKVFYLPTMSVLESEEETMENNPPTGFKLNVIKNNYPTDQHSQNVKMIHHHDIYQHKADFPNNPIPVIKPMLLRLSDLSFKLGDPSNIQDPSFKKKMAKLLYHYQTVFNVEANELGVQNIYQALMDVSITGHTNQHDMPVMQDNFWLPSDTAL